MSVYGDMLDALVEEVSEALGVAATRDPSAVAGLVSQGGCILVGFPTHVGRLLSGPNLQVPVSLVAPAPSDLQSVDWLLDHMDALINTVGAKSVTTGPIDIGSSTYPAVTATAQIALQSTGAAQ